MGKKILWLVLLTLSLFGIQCGGKEKEPEVIRPVYTMTVGGPGAGQSRSFSGIAKAQKEIILSFRVGGQIIEMNLKVGRKVQPGEVFARLDPKDAELTVSQNQAALGDAQAKLQNAKAEYERVRKLYESGSISASELDAALANYRSARANREAAQKGLELAQQQLSYTTLVSSVNGEITKKTAEIFETVSAGQEIGIMVTGDEIEMEIGIPETLVNYIHMNMPATIRFESFPGEVFSAKVTEVGRAPTEATTYPVKLLLSRTDPRIRPGMVGEVTFVFSGDEDSKTIALPPQVVVGEGKERYVWVVNPKTNTVSKRDVEIGNLESAGLVIKKGVARGEIIVTRGVHRLEEGQKVKPVEDDKVVP